MCVCVCVFVCKADIFKKMQADSKENGERIFRKMIAVNLGTFSMKAGVKEPMNSQAEMGERSHLIICLQMRLLALLME